ncbi:hypothetical protein ACLOJK_007703 [Asimina triloba]
MEPITGGQRSSPSTDGSFTSGHSPAASFFRSGGTISIRPNPRSNVATPISSPAAGHGRTKMQQIDRQLSEIGDPASEQRPIKSTITHHYITGHQPFKKHHKAFSPSSIFPFSNASSRSSIASISRFKWAAPPNRDLNQSQMENPTAMAGHDHSTIRLQPDETPTSRPTIGNASIRILQQEFTQGESHSNPWQESHTQSSSGNRRKTVFH